MGELVWFAAHTKPRCEKKLVQYCQRETLHTYLPCYKSAHKYRGKALIFQKPLFPGYVFLHMEKERQTKVVQSDFVANVLTVFDQELFVLQLEQIRLALETELEIRLAPAIGEGNRVKIKSGPLQGIEGWVEKRYGMNTVLLRLDFISQAAAVKMDATNLEII
jgi:transcription antitermination factor NusG